MMSLAYKAAVDKAAAILETYGRSFPGEPFPTIKNKLFPLISAQAALNGVDNVYVKRFKENMAPVVGQLRRVRESNEPYTPEEDHGIIILCPSLSLEWHRFILVKEASHLMLDGPSDFIHTETDLDNLLLCMAQFGREGVTKHYVSEQRAVVCAIELLLPKPTRDELLASYRSGQLSPANISKAARIPAEIIREAMSTDYCEMIEQLHVDVV